MTSARDLRDAYRRLSIAIRAQKFASAAKIMREFRDAGNKLSELRHPDSETQASISLASVQFLTAVRLVASKGNDISAWEKALDPHLNAGLAALEAAKLEYEL